MTTAIAGHRTFRPADHVASTGARRDAEKHLVDMRPDVVARSLQVAWSVEIACVGIGLLMAIVVGFEAAGIGPGIFAAAPFVAAAVVELARIPLVRMYFAAHGLFWRLLAVAAILLAGALTAENLIFGFERAFTVRIEEVRRAAQAADSATAAVRRAETETIAAAAAVQSLADQRASILSQMENRRQMTNTDIDRAEQAANRGRESATRDLEAAQRAREALATQQGRERTRMAALCNQDHELCRMTNLLRTHAAQMAEKERHIGDARAAIAALDERTAGVRESGQRVRDEELLRLGGDIEALDLRMATERERQAEKQSALASAAQVESHARDDADALRGHSQMHRMARFFLGADDNNAALRMLGWFSIVSAVVLSTVGSVLAAVHYRVQTQPPRAPNAPSKISNAIRRWIARRRGRYSVVKTVEVVQRVEVPVEKIVEKPVVTIVPELVLVPVPLEAREAERRRIMEDAAAAHPQRMAG
jgi:hypothetical protein